MYRRFGVRREWRRLVIAGSTLGCALACSGGSVIARNGTATLTDGRVATLVARSGTRDPGGFAEAIVTTWGTSQALARAAAAYDTLNDSVAMARALDAAVVRGRLQQWLDLESQRWIAEDSGRYRTRYAAGDPLAAKDVAFAPPAGDTSPAGLGRARVHARAFRAKATPASFESVARVSGGEFQNLGVFGAGRLSPQLEKAVRATPPGRISPVIATPFGAHVLYRPTFDEVAAAVVAHDRPATLARAQRTYTARVDSVGNARLAPNAVPLVRTVVGNPEGHQADSAVIATSAVRALTAARLAWWLPVFPRQMLAQVAGAPDSIVRLFVTNIVGYEVVLRSADSAHVALDSSATANLRRRYVGSIVDAWSTLGINPRSLDERGSTVQARARLAARRVDSYLDALLAPKSRARDVAVPAEVESVLRAKYPTSVDSSALARLVTDMRRRRAVADAAHDARLPKSAEPLPTVR
jgi:hypothetical protein